MSNATDEDEFVYLNRLSQSIRNNVIEECARLVEQSYGLTDLADAIRALKGKSNG